MKKRISKYRLFFVGIFALLCVMACLCLVKTPTAPIAFAASATESDKTTLVYKETPTENVQYEALERVNYVNTSACRIINPETDRFEGIMGKNAVRKTPSSASKVYQLYFDNCFEIKKTYEISFYAKTVNAANDFYVKVWYTSDGNLTKKEDLPKLETVDGEWTKYSFTFTSDKNLYTCFKLTLEPKNSFEEIYYDGFSAVLVDDNYAPTICGEQFSATDWTAGVESGEITSFNGENYPAALKVSTGSLISKIFEVPTSDIFRLRFALQKTAGASVSFTVKNAVGESIDEVALTSTSTLSYYDIATSDLSSQDFVYLQFNTVCDTENDYAVIGMIEMIEHIHQTSQNDTVYDFSNCKKTTPCKLCGLDLVTYFHDFKTEREATCAVDGLQICQNVECGLRVTLPATGEHTYKDVRCSAENAGTPLNCTVCGGGRFRLPEEHDLVCVSVSVTGHKFACKYCSYEEEAKSHNTDDIVIAKKPSATENGHAVLNCAECAQKHSVYLPCLDENDTTWTMTVEKEEDCTETGVIRYTLNEMSAVYVEYETEALGHDYEEIKRMPNCTENGVSLYHKCKTCGYVKETETEIKELEAYGHELTEWLVEKEPTLEQDGLRKKYCSRCEALIEEEVIPHLDEVNYVKYALDDHNEEEGFYYYYESSEYGTYSVFVEGTNKDGNTVTIICVLAGVVIVVGVAAYCIVAMKSKNKKE